MSAEDWPGGTETNCVTNLHYQPPRTECFICTSNGGTSGKLTSCAVCGIYGCTNCQSSISDTEKYACIKHTDDEIAARNTATTRGHLIEPVRSISLGKRSPTHPVPTAIHATGSPYYGSERQLKWANDIKARFQLLADATEDKTIPDMPYAKFWIDRRNSTLDQIRIDAMTKRPIRE